MSGTGKPMIKYIHMAIVLLTQFGFSYIPAPGEITELGMKCLGILIGTLWGWVFVEVLWPSLSGLLAFGLSGYYESMTQAFGNSFGSQMAVFILALLFITAFVQQSKMSELIIGAFMKLKIAQRSGWGMLYVFFVAAFAVAVMTQSTATVILFIAIYRDMAKKIGLAQGSKVNAFVLCGLILCVSASEVAAPFKGGCLFGVAVFSQMTGIGINWLIYTVIAISLILLAIALYCMIGKMVFKVDAGVFSSAAEQINFNVKATKQHKMALACIFVFMLALIMQSVFPADWAISVFLNYIGIGGIGLILILVMCLIRIDGKPLLNMQELANSFIWGMYCMMAFFTPFATALVDERTGIQATLVDVITPITETFSGYVIVLMLLFVVALLTNFLNNGIVGLVAVAALATLYGVIDGINFMAAAICVFTCANTTALATPAASPNCAITYTVTDLVNKSDLMKIGTVSAIVMYVWTSVVVYGLFALFI